MQRHVPFVVAAVVAFFAFWYLPAFGMVFWSKSLDTEPGAWTWRVWEALAFAGAAAVGGTALASARVTRLPAVVLGVPLVLLGGFGASSEEHAKSVARLLPELSFWSGEQSTQAMVHWFALNGGYLLLGAALLFAALRPTRVRPAGRLLSVMIGLFTIALAWWWITETIWRDPWLKLPGLLGAAAIVGALASTSLPSRWGPFAAGAPLFLLGLWGVFGLADYMDTFVGDVADLLTSDGSDELRVQKALVDLVEVYLVIGGSLVVAALIPWRPGAAPRTAKAEAAA